MFVFVAQSKTQCMYIIILYSMIISRLENAVKHRGRVPAKVEFPCKNPVLGTLVPAKSNSGITYNTIVR